MFIYMKKENIYIYIYQPMLRDRDTCIVQDDTQNPS